MTPTLLSFWLAAAPSGAPAVTVVVSGPSAAQTRAALETAELPVELRAAPLPTAAVVPASTGPWPQALAAARKAYVAADFASCLKALEGDGAVPQLLAAGERLLAARLLTWRAACHLGAQQPEPARLAAEALAAYQLATPEDVGSTTPDVEALLARGAAQVGARPLEPLALTSTPEGASVDLDGRPSACTTPCRLEVLAGGHVVRLSADGYRPSWRVVSGAAALTLEPADPELAAAQWQRRAATGEALDTEASVKLLSTALRAPRLLVVASEPASPLALRGALAVDGVLQARAARDGDAEGLVRDLLVRGKVIEVAPPLYKRWPFWVAVGAAAIAAGVTSAVVVSTRRTVTRVELNP